MELLGHSRHASQNCTPAHVHCPTNKWGKLHSDTDVPHGQPHGGVHSEKANSLTISKQPHFLHAWLIRFGLSFNKPTHTTQLNIYILYCIVL